MNIESKPATPLRAQMIYDTITRGPGRTSQRCHVRSCEQFAVWLGRSLDTATPDEAKLLQKHLIESGAAIQNRHRVMTGVKFLFRATLRRHGLVAEIFRVNEPMRVPLMLCQAEIKRLLALAPDLRSRTMLSLAYGCGLRASEVVKLRVGDIDSDQGIRGSGDQGIRGSGDQGIRGSGDQGIIQILN